MRIYHFNTYQHGGAFTAAKRIADASSSFVDDVKFYTKLPPPAASYFYQLPAFSPERGAKKLKKLLTNKLYNNYINKLTKGKLNQFEKFSVVKLPFNTTLPSDDGFPDIVHLHWVADLLDYKSFFSSIPKGLPIVWTMHDMNPFTGGCHYALNCNKYLDECGGCPQINLPISERLTRKIKLIKKHIYSDLNIQAVSPSNWLTNEAKKSGLFADVKTIQYPINAYTEFVPRDKTISKQILGLPHDHKILAFGAENIDVPRKGFNLLVEALRLLYKERNDITCLVFGNGKVAIQNSDLPLLVYTGFVASPMLQSTIYSAADVFVIPSIQENLAQTQLEAMACETPIVGFTNTGAEDLVNESHTGALAENGNIIDLKDKIAGLLANEELLKQMGKDARQFIIDKMSYAHIGEQYYQLYQSLLEKT